MHDLLRVEFPNVNHKRVHSLYSDENLAAPKRRTMRRPPSECAPLNMATQVNAVLSMEHVGDRMANGRR